METDRFRFIKGKTCLPSFSETTQRLNLMTQKGVKSLHKDTFKLPRKIPVWNNFQSIILRYYKNFHLGHFTFPGNIYLTLRRSSFQRLSRTYLFIFLHFTLCFTSIWSFFTTYFYTGLQFSDFFFNCETISYRCLAQITENLIKSSIWVVFCLFVCYCSFFPL